jgi:hypothetical protein
MAVSGHLHTFANLFSGKVPALATEQETGWASELLSARGCFGEENLLITLQFHSFLAVVSHYPQCPVHSYVCLIMGSVCG